MPAGAPSYWRSRSHDELEAEVYRLEGENERLRKGVQLAIEWFTMPVGAFQEKHHVDDADEIEAILGRYLTIPSELGGE